MRILIVDDEKLIAEDLSNEVKTLYPDAVVDAVCTAPDALRLAKGAEYDVAFLDIDMPDMNGLTLARRLIALWPGVNIIFVTGHMEYALEAHELYCSGFLMKPVGIRKLKKAFENLRKPFVHIPEKFYEQHYQGNNVMGKKLEMYREQRGFSRQEIADLMNVTRQTVFRWEHGERIPDILTFIRLVRLLGVELEDVLEPDEEI